MAEEFNEEFNEDDEEDDDDESKPAEAEFNAACCTLDLKHAMQFPFRAKNIEASLEARLR